MRRVREVTEEVARWVFEVHVEHLPNWQIAFTNPTAGPWKLVVGRNENGVPGEVHRFERESERPDLIIYSDQQQIVLIIEAKGAVEDLTRSKQTQKSVNVVAELTKILRSKRASHYWGKRADYTYLTAVLWGSESLTHPQKVHSVLATYDTACEEADLATPILGIESLREEGGDEIVCLGHTLAPTKAVRKGLTVAQALESLGLRG